MKNLLLFLLCFLPQTVFSQEKIDVVASVPDLGDMAGRIGGDKVNITTLATGREDLHAVPVRPSFLPILNRADIVLSLGLGAEHAWLPALAADARNAKVMKGRSGWIEVYKGIEILEVPTILDRSEGEQHPDGNPHYNIGPHCGIAMATNIAAAFGNASPVDSGYFQTRLSGYTVELRKMVDSLKEVGTPLKGLRIIQYHADLAYLVAFYEMEIFGSIEPKPGVPPTAGHLRTLEEEARKSGIDLIVHNQTQSPKIPNKLARALGCAVVEIANMVGAKRGIQTWIQLQEYNNRMLLEALGEE